MGEEAVDNITNEQLGGKDTFHIYDNLSPLSKAQRHIRNFGVFRKTNVALCTLGGLLVVCVIVIALLSAELHQSPVTSSGDPDAYPRVAKLVQGLKVKATFIKAVSGKTYQDVKQRKWLVDATITRRGLVVVADANNMVKAVNMDDGAIAWVSNITIPWRVLELNNDILVSHDESYHAVTMLDPDTGEFMRDVEYPDIRYPVDTCVFPDQKTLVLTDWASGNVHVADAATHKTLHTFHPVLRATHVACCPNGDIVTGSWSLNNVRRFTKTGQFLWDYGDPGNETWQLKYPHGLACDNKRVFICEWGNQRVTVVSSAGRYVQTLFARRADWTGRPHAVVLWTRRGQRHLVLAQGAGTIKLYRLEEV